MNKAETRTNCSFCQSNNSSLHYNEGEWNIVKCDTCGLYYTNPRPTPEDLPLYYNEEYYKEIFYTKSKK